MKFVSGAMGFVSGGIRVKIVEPISRGENDTQAAQNKQSVCEIMMGQEDFWHKVFILQIMIIISWKVCASVS